MTGMAFSCLILPVPYYDYGKFKGLREDFICTCFSPSGNVSISIINHLLHIDKIKCCPYIRICHERTIFEKACEWCGNMIYKNPWENKENNHKIMIISSDDGESDEKRRNEYLP